MSESPQHPIFASLIAPAHPCDRHALLHAMERQLAAVKAPCPGLHARVHGFVDRGVPYFAPADAHYREWAARAAQLWDELQQRAAVPTLPVSPALACAA